MSEKKGFFGRLFGTENKQISAEPERDEPVPDAATDKPLSTGPKTSAGVLSEQENTAASRKQHTSEVTELDHTAARGEPAEVPPKPATQPVEPADGIEPCAEPAVAETIEDAEQNAQASRVIITDEPEKKHGFFGRLTQGLSKTSTQLSDGVSAIFTKRKLDKETLEELEDLLITADLGVNAAARITAALARDKFDKEITDEEVRTVLADHIAQSLTPLEKPIEINAGHKPHIILMTGVNGAGKTTTIGKLAHKFRDEGKTVMLAAADTFRAAAIEQLTVWGDRVGAPVIAREVGADAAGLAFDALKQAQAQDIDVLMIDTAGRLQNRTELMDELAKIVRVIRKLDESAPHDTILVLDATVGQNAINQAAVFTEIAGVSGLVMTKLDGTARGGVLVALADKFALPIHYVGVGESVEDLQAFNANQFTQALTGISSMTEAA